MNTMIGQLLNHFAPLRSSQTRDSQIPDSVTEDEHTRGLLFPDALSIQNTQGVTVPLTPVPSASAAGSGAVRSCDDLSGDVELDQWKDVRIIVAQDETGLDGRTVLYDSRGPSSSSLATDRLEQKVTRPSRSASNAGTYHNSGRRLSTHVRRTSLSSPTSETSCPPSPSAAERGAFARNSFRRTSISSMPNIDETGSAQPIDLDENTRTYLDCMFGNTAISYKGPTTKLHHITPKEGSVEIHSPYQSQSSIGFGSLSRAEGRRRSQAGQGLQSPLLAGAYDALPSAAGSTGREGNRRHIMVTRTFSVCMPEEARADGRVADSKRKSQDGNGYSGHSPQGKKHGRAPVSGSNQTKAGSRLRKLPSYAIAVIFYLPPSSPQPSIYRRSGSSGRMGRPVPTSSYDNDLTSSSVESDRNYRFFAERNISMDSLASAILESDVNDRMDIVTQHWDIASRILASLQYIVKEKIIKLYKSGESGPSTKVANAPKQQRKSWNFGPEPRADYSASFNFKLRPYSLSLDPEIKFAVDNMIDRLVRGMKIPRVITGQGRWGIWREEARWIGSWAGGRDQNFFFFNMLTAFLGHHTEWLSILGPLWYRRRHHEQQRSSPVEGTIITNRTVIVCSNKMAARRLIFLLSAFLPATQPFHEPSNHGRTTRSASIRAYSQSPPTPSLSREASLRKQINRRTQAKRPTIRTHSIPRGSALSPLQSNDNNVEEENTDTIEDSRQSRQQLKEVRSQKPVNLPIPTKPENIRMKSPAVTTSRNTTPEAVPVAHFTNRPTVSTMSRETLRPGSSGSLAEANLAHTLQRSDSANVSNLSFGSQTGTRWGSFMSVWSGSRRESSTDQSDCNPSGEDGLGITGMSNASTNDIDSVDYRHKSKLQQMTDEVSADRDLFVEDVMYNERRSQSDSLQSPRDTHSSPTDITRSQARTIPQVSQKQHGSQLKLSVNENDGIIDVEVPIPSFGSASKSPIALGAGGIGAEGSYTSLEDTIRVGGRVDESQPAMRPTSVCGSGGDSEQQPLYVAGWLKLFHPDFVLQAVGPYSGLESQVRTAMKAEPTPASVLAMGSGSEKIAEPTEKWVDVCTTLIADAQSFSIKRLRLRRLIRFTPLPGVVGNAQASMGTATVNGSDESSQLKSQYGNPYSQNALTPLVTASEHHLEERFIEEPIMDMDGTLADAIEKLLAHNGTSTGPASSASTATTTALGPRKGLSRATSVTSVRSLPSSPSPLLESVKSPTRGRHGQSHQNYHHQQSQQQHVNKSAIAEIPRAECKELVLGALREVVKSVTTSRVSDGERQGAAIDTGLGLKVEQTQGKEETRRKKKQQQLGKGEVFALRESTLREGIRRWLAEVEDDGPGKA